MDINGTINNAGNEPPAPANDPGAVINPQPGAMATPAAPIEVSAPDPRPEPAPPLSGVTAPMPTANAPVNPLPTTPPTVDPMSGATHEQAVPAPKQAAFMDPNHTPMVGASGSSLKASKGKKLKVLVTALIIVLVGGGGGAYAFMQGQNNKPENVVAKSLATALTSQSYEASGIVSVDDQSSKSSGTMNMGFKVDTPSQAIEVSLALNSVKSGALTVDDLKFGATARFIKNDVYFKIDNLKQTIDTAFKTIEQTVGDSGITEQYKPLKESADKVADKISDKWVKVPSKDVDSAGLKCLSDNKEPSSAELKAFKTTYKQHAFLKMKQRNPNEVIDGVSNLHYTLAVDDKKLTDFSNALKDVQRFKDINECTKKATGSDTSGADQAHDATSKSKVGDIDYWVKSTTKSLTRVKVPVTDESSTGTIDVKFNFDKPVKIDAPTDAMSWDDFVKLVESSLQDAGIPSLEGIDGTGASGGLVNGLMTDIPNIIPSH